MNQKTMNNNQLFLFLFLFSFTPFFLFSQNIIQGKIIDAQTGSPVPFVNIGIKSLGSGSVSDEVGVFQLSIEKAKPDDLVSISSIGYEGRELSVSSLKENPVIQLSAVTYTIDKVELLAKQWSSKTITIGNDKRKRKQSVGFANSQLGTEIAALLPIEQETWIKSAHFIVNRGSRDSLLFRLNIFQYENGQKGDNLVRENILLPAPTKKGLMSIDLEKYNLVTDQPILLSLQWIKAYEKTDKLLITFNAQKAAAKENLYLKHSSVTGFSKISEAFPGAPKYELCFYIKGQEVKR